MATFTNQARLTYTGGSAASNITVGELVEVLTATKTAVVPNYQRGGTVTYLITLTNTGTTALTNLTVTDDLGGYTFGANTVYPLAYTAGSVRYYQNGALQAAPAVTAGPPLTISGITVPAGRNVTLAYEAAATEFAPLAAESTVVNTATAAGAGQSGDGHGDGVSAVRCPARHQQGALAHHRDGERAAHVYLYRAEQRQHRGGRGGQRGHHRHL